MCLADLAKELHAHDGKDEDDDAKHEGQVGQRPHRVHHDRQDVVQRLPGLGQLKHPGRKVNIMGMLTYYILRKSVNSLGELNDDVFTNLIKH
jgi:hypothetical protein